MNKINKVNIPVKMGSKKLQINYEYTLNNFYLTSSDLIEIVIKKLFSKNSKLNELKKTYCLYENAFGVERMVDNQENILNLVLNQVELNSNDYRFTIRKRDQINRKKQTLNVKKCFAKLESNRNGRKMIKNQNENNLVDELNQAIIMDDEYQVKNLFLKTIFQNEIILNDQINKLDSLDRIIEQEKTSHRNNQNIFQSFYDKLRHNKNSHKNSMNQSSMYLIDSAGECSSTSSSRCSSSSKLDTLI